MSKLSMGITALWLALPGLVAAQDSMTGHEHHHSDTPPAKQARSVSHEPMQHGDMDAMPGMGQAAQATESSPADHAGHDMVKMDTQTLPPNNHISPPPPQTQLGDMSPQHMVEMMQMNDLANRGMWLFDRLERTRSIRGDYATAWQAEGWWGSDINRVWLRTEGERTNEGTHDARVEVLWGHAWSTFWDWQLGVRHDFGQGPNRQWLAAGVQGLAPYWFKTEATFYAGSQGRTALRLEASYDLRFTQRLILAPELELNFYGKDDPRRGVRSGLSDMEAGVRLRYEFSRRFAPYIGVNWTRRFADRERLGGEPARDTAWLVGVRLWF
ncbi:copper resistance protein B [Dyella subtropica]|uniref:copper resistance protein B n=1 Tax=Dyella subtropica TaxID=2992127 RepID=UPI002258EAFC|nr:copper resistance protein B [Dyella subtropica]